MTRKRTRGRHHALALAILLLAASTMGLPTVALSEDYSYTIRVFAGNKGTVNGQDVVTLSRHKGETVDLSSDVDVSVTDSAYYHKGFREAGRDSEFPYRSFAADRDIDLVASYGMRVNMVRLTVHLRNYQTGEPLVSEDGTSEVTYEYRSGDKPVVAFRYVEGYRPLYRNVTGTITEDTDWYLDYVPIQPAEVPAEDASTGTDATNGTGTQAGRNQQEPGSQRQGEQSESGQGGTPGQTQDETSDQTPNQPEGQPIRPDDATSPASTEQPEGSNEGVAGNGDARDNGTGDTDSSNGTNPRSDESVSGDSYPPTEDIQDNDIPLSNPAASNPKPDGEENQEKKGSGQGILAWMLSWMRNHKLAISIVSGIVLAIAMVLIALLSFTRRKSKDNDS